MRDQDKSKEQLIQELSFLRQQLADLEASLEQRTSAEQTLQEAETIYRNILDNAVTGFFQTTPEGSFLIANFAMAHMLGYRSPLELTSNTTDIAKQIYVDKNRRLEFQERLSTNGIVREFEYQAYRNDGRLIWLSDNARVVRDMDGSVLYYEGCSLDITERKQAELERQAQEAELKDKFAQRTAALREANENLISEVAQRYQQKKALKETRDQLQAILETVPGIVSCVSSDLNYLGVNQGLADIFNLSPADFIGQNIGFLGAGSEFNRFLQKFFAEMGEDACEEISANIKGSIRNYLIVAKKYNQNQAAFAVGIDITERRQAQIALQETEDKLQTLLETFPGIVSCVSSGLRYLGVNQELANMFNLSPADFIAKDIGFLNTSSDFNNFVRQFFASGDQDDYREITAQIHSHTHNYLVIAQKYAHGEAAFFVGLDITQRRQAEEALRTSKAQLEAVLSAVPGIVSWIDCDLKYLGVNQRLAQTFNLSREAFVGKDIGFLGSSLEFRKFIQDFFASPAAEDSREVSAQVNGIKRHYLIVTQKYEGGKAAFVVGIDISQRRQIEHALQGAEQKYRHIFENTVEGIFQTSPEGYYLSANPALARIYGYRTPEELIASLTSLGRQLYVQPERRLVFIHLLESQGIVINFESQIYRKDGRIVWISENARAVRDANDHTLYYEGTVEDITPRKEAELALAKANEQLESRVEERTAALREANRQLVSEISERKRIEIALRNSEAELRALFAAMTDVITVFDAQGQYVKVISTNSEVLYTPTKERVGKTVYDVLPREKADFVVSQIQLALNTGETVNVEYSLEVNKSNNGVIAPQKVWFAASISPLPENCVIWVARNITERKQVMDAVQKAEEKYRSIFENSAEGIFQSTRDGRYLSVNQALVQMFGYSSAEELIATMTDLSRQLYVDLSHRTRFITAIEKQGSVINFESECYRKDGSVIWTSENTRAVRDDQGNLLYYEGIMQDITKRKQAEQALLKEQEKSERLLLNILPQAIAQQLKQNQRCIAERFEQVTILFADIVEFTNLSSMVQPTQLVDLLNDIFSTFDQLAEKHGLEKIKTIGDAYMVVGGLPEFRANHAEAIAEMALEMQQEITNFTLKDGKPFRLRIGINTGLVVAGVIGIKKFSYDLWGDTVNVASRMESQGEPGRIQMTQTTYELLKHKYNFVIRQAVHIKGKGSMTTYWLEGRKNRSSSQ